MPTSTWPLPRSAPSAPRAIAPSSRCQTWPRTAGTPRCTAGTSQPSWSGWGGSNRPPPTHGAARGCPPPRATPQCGAACSCTTPRPPPTATTHAAAASSWSRPSASPCPQLTECHPPAAQQSVSQPPGALLSLLPCPHPVPPRLASASVRRLPCRAGPSHCCRQPCLQLSACLLSAHLPARLLAHLRLCQPAPALAPWCWALPLA